MESIVHFKVTADKIFLLKKLEKLHPQEFALYFLESLDMSTLEFREGVFLHDAFGISVAKESLWASGRQRHFKDKPTIFNLSLDKEVAFQLAENEEMNGIVFPLEMNTPGPQEKDHFFFFLSFTGDSKVYQIR